MREDKEKSFIRIDFFEDEEENALCKVMWENLRENATMEILSGIAALVCAVVRSSKSRDITLSYCWENINAMVYENLVEIAKGEEKDANSS